MGQADLCLHVALPLPFKLQRHSAAEYTEPIECSAPDPPQPTPAHTGDCRTACPAAHCSPNRHDPFTRRCHRGAGRRAQPLIAAPGAELSRTCSVSRVSDCVLG